MDAPSLRFGVVGCGAVTDRYHLPAMLASRDVRVSAFVDPIIDRARAFAARIPGARAFSRHCELIGVADAVLVATPNAYHEPIAVDLLKAGMHVLVEKPMARTRAECDRMIAAAAKGGVVLGVGQDFRHFPIARVAHTFFAAQPLGSIRRVTVQQSAGARWPSVSPDALSRDSGGGVLISFGVHTFDLLLWWLGNLRAITYHDDANGGVEAECECELQLENGAPVLLELSRRRTLRDTVIADCERGAIEIGVYEPAIVRISTPAGASPVAGSVADPEFARAPLRTVFGRQLAEFVAAISEGRQPLVGGTEGRRVVSLVEDCYALRRPLRRPWDYPESYASVQSVAREGPAPERR